MDILVIDIGNSRIKWAHTGGSRGQSQGVIAHDGWSELQREWAALPKPDRILVSNVAGQSAALAITAACGQWLTPIEFVRAGARQCGVRNGYKNPSQLGSDRWAALIAAWHRVQGACLVVNCGTASTVDALSAKGEFLGGCILPGLAMMRQSLKAGTAQLSETEGCWQIFPRNTADAIYSGALAATAGAIRRQHEMLGHKDAPCLLTGGASESITSLIELPLICVDDLVLLGLQLIAEDKGR